jgi:hypothetical protein
MRPLTSRLEVALLLIGCRLRGNDGGPDTVHSEAETRRGARHTEDLTNLRQGAQSMAKSTAFLRDDESPEPGSLECSKALLRPAGLLIHLGILRRHDIPGDLARTLEHRIQITSEHACHHVVLNMAINRAMRMSTLPDELGAAPRSAG